MPLRSRSEEPTAVRVVATRRRCFLSASICGFDWARDHGSVCVADNVQCSRTNLGGVFRTCFAAPSLRPCGFAALRFIPDLDLMH